MRLLDQVRALFWRFSGEAERAAIARELLQRAETAARRIEQGFEALDDPQVFEANEVALTACISHTNAVGHGHCGDKLAFLAIVRASSLTT